MENGKTWFTTANIAHSPSYSNIWLGLHYRPEAKHDNTPLHFSAGVMVLIAESETCLTEV
jgi:hypothetical protein